MTDYMIFNPYRHLTKAQRLTQEQWTRIKAQLSKSDLVNIEQGGKIPVGKAALVWKAGTCYKIEAK